MHFVSVLSTARLLRSHGSAVLTAVVLPTSFPFLFLFEIVSCRETLRDRVKTLFPWDFHTLVYRAKARCIPGRCCTTQPALQTSPSNPSRMDRAWLDINVVNTRLPRSCRYWLAQCHTVLCSLLSRLPTFHIYSIYIRGVLL